MKLNSHQRINMRKEKSILTKDSMKFMERYINTSSPTGNEIEGQKIWMEYLKPYVDTFITDSYGTAVGVINPDSEFKVVIEAHADEISWRVNYITSEGLIYVLRNGGSDHMIAPSKRVKIHTKKGLVDGVFGWPAIHTRGGGEKEDTPSTKNIFIDVGCTNKVDVEEMGIHVGCLITYPDEFFILNKENFVGRALDNRMGGVMIAEVAKLLKEKKKTLPFGLYIVNSVQEEIGLRGAEMIAQRLKPNVAIITDVCHDTTTPMISKNEGETKNGDGPVITYGPAVQNNLRELIVNTAIENDIPFQRMSSSSSTGTDTDAFAYSNGGVPSALISLPLRYMHTTVEMVNKNDVENVIELIYRTLLKIEAGEDFSYFK